MPGIQLRDPAFIYEDTCLALTSPPSPLLPLSPYTHPGHIPQHPQQIKQLYSVGEKPSLLASNSRASSFQRRTAWTWCSWCTSPTTSPRTRSTRCSPSWRASCRRLTSTRAASESELLSTAGKSCRCRRTGCSPSWRMQYRRRTQVSAAGALTMNRDYGRPGLNQSSWL